jgi:GT2 family glycosyltransferase
VSAYCEGVMERLRQTDLDRPAPLAVSVIVPVRNDRAGHLRQLVEALTRQTLARGRFEIVVGDDGSTDDSIRAFATEDGWVRVVHGPPRNAYAARNMAVADARPSDVLAFVDSDCIPDPGWLEAGIAALEDAEAAAGDIRFTLPKERTLWTYLDVEATKDHESQVRTANAETANFFIRRDVFERLGGFDPSLSDHSDFEFARRLVGAGHRLVYAPDASCVHPARSSGRSFLRMVWGSHRCYAVHEVREGRRPLGLTLRWWFPLLLHVKWRRDSGRSLRLDRRLLGKNGLRPTLADDLRAVPLMYVFLPYFAGFAQLRGWAQARRAQ